MKHDADHWWTCECDGCRCISYPSVPAVEPPHTVTVASQYGRDVTEVARRWHVISDLGTTAWLTESAALVEATNIRAHRTHVEVRVTVECKVTEIP